MVKRLLSVLLTVTLLLTALTACSFDFKSKKKNNKDKDKETEKTTATQAATTATTAFPLYYVTADPSLNVRSEPKVDSTRLGQLPLGTPVEILETIDGWHRISYNGMPGYISAEYVSAQAPSTTAPAPTTTLPPRTILYVTANKLNVRSEPATTGARLGELLYGDVIEILGTVNGWYEISFGGGTGYVSADYASVTPPSGVSTVTTTTTTTAPTTTTTASKYPDASIPAMRGGLSEAEREELYDGLQDIIDSKGADYQSIYNYVNKNKTYTSMAEGESIEQMAYYTLTHKSASCYYYAAFTYLLMKQAGYPVDFVRGIGWQHGTEHCWIMFQDTDGWYFMDSLYVRSAKLTTAECVEIGYKWNPDVHPEAK